MDLGSYNSKTNTCVHLERAGPVNHAYAITNNLPLDKHNSISLEHLQQLLHSHCLFPVK